MHFGHIYSPPIPPRSTLPSLPTQLCIPFLNVSYLSYTYTLGVVAFQECGRPSRDHSLKEN